MLHDPDDYSPEATARRRELILEIVDNQLNGPEIPEVKVQYDRIRALGHSDKVVRLMIANRLVKYIWHKMRGDPYTNEDYIRDLKALPDPNEIWE